jgi:hypothetical protein
MCINTSKVCLVKSNFGGLRTPVDRTIFFFSFFKGLHVLGFFDQSYDFSRKSLSKYLMDTIEFSYFIFHLYAKVGHSIRWNALHEDAYKFFLLIDQPPGNNCVLFIELFTNRHVSAIKKNNYSIFIPIVAIWSWGLRNNYFIDGHIEFPYCRLFFDKSNKRSIKLETAVKWSKSNLNMMNIYEESTINSLTENAKIF